MASVAEILLAQGRLARETRMARGGVWAPLVQQLSNLPAAMLEDRDQRRAAEAQAAMQAEDRALKQRSDEQAYALNQQRLSEGERTAAARTAKIEILSNAVEEDGSFNLPKAMALIEERGWGDVVDPEDLKTWDQQYDQQAYARARQIQQDDRQLAQDRQAENQRGVRRMIGESIQSRGGQPLSPQEAQTYQGMAFQEGLTLPDGMLPKPDEWVTMTVKGEGGRPKKVQVPASQLRNGGVEEYREPPGASGGSSYFTPIQTAQGIVSFDNRTGQVVGRIGDLKPGETAQRELANGQTILSMMERITAGLTPEKIGPIAGRYKTVEAAISGGDPTFATLAAQTAQLQNVVINLRTGAAMSEPEAGRIMAELPGVNLPPATYVARLKNAQKYYQDWQKNRSTLAFGRTTDQGVNDMTTGGDTAPPPQVGGVPSYQDYLRSRQVGPRR